MAYLEKSIFSSFSEKMKSHWRVLGAAVVLTAVTGGIGLIERDTLDICESDWQRSGCLALLLEALKAEKSGFYIEETGEMSPDPQVQELTGVYTFARRPYPHLSLQNTIANNVPAFILSTGTFGTYSPVIATGGDVSETIPGTLVLNLEVRPVEL